MKREGRVRSLNVSPVEVVLAIVAAALFGALVVVLWTRHPESAPGGDGWGQVFQDVGALKASVDGLRATQVSVHDALRSLDARVEERVGGLKSRLQEAEGKLLQETGTVRQALQGELQGARQALAVLQTQAEERRRLEERLQASTQRIEAVVAGGAGKGAAGENILREALRQLPAEMIQMDFKVRGQPVEFALILADGKRLPIDSKMAAADLLDRMSTATDPLERERLREAVESEVEKRAKEAAKYVDAAVTVPFAVAALPDAVFGLLRKAHATAYHQWKVLLVPYSLTLPFVLAFYRLHLTLAAPVDLEALKAALAQIDQALQGMEAVLENKMARGTTMVQNAYGEMKILAAAVRSAVTSVRTLPGPAEEPPALSGGPGGTSDG